MRTTGACLYIFLGLWILSGEVYATTVVLGAAKDNTLYESSTGGLSNGAGSYFFSGRTGQPAESIRRGLIQFDIVGNIPAGATIESVELTLHMSKTSITAGARSVSLRRLLADWGEGASDAISEEGSGAAATTDDATWIHTYFDTSSWADTGGAFSPVVSASIVVGGISSYTWGSTIQMVADVQSWLDTPGENNGWLLLGDESEPSTGKRFDTRENLIVNDRPQLTIGYSTVTCDCPFQGDMNGDSTPDAVDLNALIQALFFGGPNTQDPLCPTTRGDVTADDVPDAVDLNYMIQTLFFGGPNPVDPCTQ